MNINKLVNKGSIRRFSFLAVSLGISLLAETSSFASTVQLQWNPNSEPDVAGYNIYYKAGSASLPLDGAGAIEGVAPIKVANQTSATISGLDPGADYYFAVTAYNTSGLESPYSEIIAIPGVKDTTAPKVSLTSPLSGSVQGGVVAVSANASDDMGISKLELFANGQLLAAGNLSPLTYNWNTTSVTSGSYTLTVKAYDAAGNSATSSVVIAVDNELPTVAVVNPVQAGTVGGTATVSVTATDNLAVNAVEFYVNGALQSTSTSAPYSFNWNTSALANGTYTLSAKAYDAAGNVGESSSTTVTVLNDTTAPTVSFLAPASNSVYGNKVSVSASATDDVGVTRMELYVDNALKYSTTNSSFNTTSNMSVGVHTITIKAYDAANNVKVASKTINRFN